MRVRYSILPLCLISFLPLRAQQGALVLQTDFGLKDGAVAAMKGVAFSVSSDLKIFDLTHEIPAFNVREAAYRLKQAAPYWPPGTVFVSVVDPGVGSGRKSIAMKSKTGHFFITPDNGTLTLVAASLGVEEVRIIDEDQNRLPGSQHSHTFHGRDVYAYTGARLAARIVPFEAIGPPMSGDIVRLDYSIPEFSGNAIRGAIEVLDVQYGNVWTNIDDLTFSKLGIGYGDKVHVRIFHQGKAVFDEEVVFGRTFADVPVGQTVAYMNSLLHFSLGLNQGNLAAERNIGYGAGWTITITARK